MDINRDITPSRSTIEVLLSVWGVVWKVATVIIACAATLAAWSYTAGQKTAVLASRDDLVSLSETLVPRVVYDAEVRALRAEDASLRLRADDHESRLRTGETERSAIKSLLERVDQKQDDEAELSRIILKRIDDLNRKP